MPSLTTGQIWLLEGYSFWAGDDWDKGIISQNMYLVIRNMKFMVIDGDLMMESFSIYNNIRSIALFDSCVGITVNVTGRVYRKFRVKFASVDGHTAEEYAKECAHVLSYYTQLKIIGKNDTHVTDSVATADKCDQARESLSERIEKLLNEDISKYHNFDCESKYPLEQAVLDCILSKDFPAFVMKVNAVLQKQIAEL